MVDGFAEFGFELVPGMLTRAEVAGLAAALNNPETAGRRGMLAHPRIARLAESARILDLVRPHLPDEPFPVRALLFDKSPAANWLVAWHQDVTIAVREFRDVPGFGPWSTKLGVPHVQPPIELLEQMLAVRLHLDDADETSGALRVLPGTHRQRRLSCDDIERLRRDIPETICNAFAGDALLMRPLLLHASGRATIPTRRRVIHIEYAACELAGGLQWYPAA